MKFNNNNARNAGTFVTNLAAAFTRDFVAYTPYPVNENTYAWGGYTWNGFVNVYVTDLGNICSSRMRMSNMVTYRVQRNE